MANTTSKYYVQSVARALTLLEAIAAKGEDGMNLPTASKLLGVSKSSAYNLLRTLHDKEFVSEDAERHLYRLGAALVRLGDSAVEQLPLANLARPILQSLSKQTGLTARLAQSQFGCPVFISRIYGAGAVRFQTPLGTQESPHSTAGGKAILSMLPAEMLKEVCDRQGLSARTPLTITRYDALLEELELVRQRGYAVDNEEDMEGIFCIGAAFSNRNDTCVGALSVSGIKSDLNIRRVEEIGGFVKDHARQLSELLGQPGT